MIAKLSENMGFKARLQLMNSLALSRLQYMMCVWGNTTPTHIRKAQVVLNQAARVVTKRNRFTSQKLLMKECGWLNVREQTTYQSLTQLWKTVWWGIPGTFRTKITAVEDDGNRLITDHPRLQLTNSQFRHQTVRKWNTLPAYLRQENKISRFKREVKNWILSQQDDAEDNDEDDDHIGRPPDEGAQGNY